MPFNNYRSFVHYALTKINNLMHKNSIICTTVYVCIDR